MLYNSLISSDLLVLALVAFVKAKCETETVESDFQNCLAEFTNLTEFSKGTFQVAKLESYCQSRAQTEIRCAQKLIEDCRNSGGSRTRRIIDNALNVDQVKRSLDIVCNNTAALESNQACIGRYEDGVEACISKADASLETKNQALAREASTEGATYYEKESYRLLCEYAEGMKACLGRLGKNCGRQVGTIFNAFGDALTPPVCSGGKRITAIIYITSLTSLVFLTAVKVIL